MLEVDKKRLISFIEKYGAVKEDLGREYSPELEEEKDRLLSKIINIIKLI